MASDPRITPTAVKAPHGADVLTLTWADGRVHAYPHRILRGYCPCAGCQGHSGRLVFVEPGSLDLRDLGQVGNYALSLTWADGHDGGIYSFRYLRRLGEMLDEMGADELESLGEMPRDRE
jgi:DUF971 family protein